MLVVTSFCFVPQSCFAAAGQANAPAKPLSPLEQSSMDAEKGFVGPRKRATLHSSSAP